MEGRFSGPEHRLAVQAPPKARKVAEPSARASLHYIPRPRYARLSLDVVQQVCILKMHCGGTALDRGNGTIRSRE